MHSAIWICCTLFRHSCAAVLALAQDEDANSGQAPRLPSSHLPRGRPSVLGQGKTWFRPGAHPVRVVAECVKVHWRARDCAASQAMWHYPLGREPGTYGIPLQALVSH